jgi:hypothetical protein
VRRRGGRWQVDEAVGALAHVADAAHAADERLLVHDALAVQGEAGELLAGQAADEELPRQPGNASPV